MSRKNLLALGILAVITLLCLHASVAEAKVAHEHETGDLGDDEPYMDGAEGEGDEGEGDMGDDEEDFDYDEKDVLILSEKNFTSTINGAPFALVEFYAPWCGHCKSLAPNYAAAATELRITTDQVILAKVDATIETKLAKKYEVEGFPTLFWFVNGEKKEYNGGRTSNDIVRWIAKRMGPAVRTVNIVDDAKALLPPADTLVVAYVENLGGPDAGVFESVAKNEDKVTFVQTSSKAVAEALFGKAVSPPAVAILKNETDKFLEFDGDLTTKNLAEFVAHNWLPVVVTFSMDKADLVFNSDVKLQVLMFATANNYTKYRGIAETVARKFKGKIIVLFVNNDEDDTSNVLEYFSLTGKDELAVIGFAANDDGKKFVMSSAFTTEAFELFCQEFVDGKLSPFYKSDPIPETNDGPVTVVVGNSFEAVVLDPTKDVLLEVYAPWCGHCQSLEPTYNKLGELFAGVDSVIIAKMDGTTNEHPRVEIEGFPTLLFFPVGDTSKGPVTVDSERKLTDLVAFIKKHTTFKFDLPPFEDLPEEKDEPPEMDAPDGEDYMGDEDNSAGVDVKDEL